MQGLLCPGSRRKQLQPDRPGVGLRTRLTCILGGHRSPEIFSMGSSVLGLGLALTLWTACVYSAWSAPELPASRCLADTHMLRTACISLPHSILDCITIGLCAPPDCHCRLALSCGSSADTLPTAHARDTGVCCRLAPPHAELQAELPSTQQRPRPHAAACWAAGITLVPQLYLYYRIVGRLCWMGYGWEAVVLSPGFAWLMPLHLVLLACVWALRSDSSCIRAKSL